MLSNSAAILMGKLAGALRDCWSPLWKMEASLKGVQFQGAVEFWGRPLVSLAQGSSIVIGDGVKIASARRANPLGLTQPSVLRTLNPEAHLILGARVGLSGTVLCAGSAIEIGEGTIMGAGVMVIDNDFHIASGAWDWATDSLSTARPVRIGRGVFVGTRAIVLKGVSIGDRAVVGAGAVVTKDVPAEHVAVGNPASFFPRHKS